MEAVFGDLADMKVVIFKNLLEGSGYLLVSQISDFCLVALDG